MTECRHESWTGYTTYYYEERRCNSCGQMTRRTIEHRPADAPRLPWPELKEESDNGGDTNPRPHR